MFIRRNIGQSGMSPNSAGWCFPQKTHFETHFCDFQRAFPTETQKAQIWVGLHCPPTVMQQPYLYTAQVAALARRSSRTSPLFSVVCPKPFLRTYKFYAFQRCWFAVYSYHQFVPDTLYYHITSYQNVTL